MTRAQISDIELCIVYLRCDRNARGCTAGVVGVPTGRGPGAVALVALGAVVAARMTRVAARLTSDSAVLAPRTA